jgi:hydrogenase maturation protease
MRLNAIDMPRTLVIGYGNPLRGDDGLGWRVAAELARLADESIEVLAVHQLTPELAEAISETEMVIFVDASYDGKPGSWRCEAITLDPIPSQALGHYFTPVQLLSCANAIFNARPFAFLISAAASSFDCGAVLSPFAAAIVPQIVQYLLQRRMECMSIQ